MGIILAYIVGGILGYAGQPTSSKQLLVHVDASTAAATTDLHLHMAAFRMAADGHLTVYANSLCSTPDSHTIDVRWDKNVYTPIDVSWPQDTDPGCQSWAVVIQNTTIASGFVPLIHGPRVTAE